VDIANEFATHFEKVSHSYHDDVGYNDFLCKRNDCIMNDLQSSYECIDSLNVELIDKCARKLKTGKACGPDDLDAEHLLYAHPVLIMHFQILFKLIFRHRFVPNSFGIGVIVPLVKDKSGNISDINNYRGITLSSVISKLFEIVLLSICNDALETDPLLFGFKDKTGTADAMFMPNSTIKHFTDRGSSVYVSSLDIRKAFDRVDDDDDDDELIITKYTSLYLRLECL